MQGMIVHLKEIIILSSASGGPRKPSKTFRCNLAKIIPFKTSVYFIKIKRHQVAVGSSSQQQMQSQDVPKPEMQVLPTQHQRGKQQHRCMNVCNFSCRAALRTLSLRLASLQAKRSLARLGHWQPAIAWQAASGSYGRSLGHNAICIQIDR
jgi:hypothetical protein